MDNINETLSFVISYEDMCRRVKNYYILQEAKVVTLKIVNEKDLDGKLTTRYELYEMSPLSCNKLEPIDLPFHKLEEIIKYGLGEDEELVKLTNNVYLNNNNNLLSNKSFTITTKEKGRKIRF